MTVHNENKTTRRNNPLGLGFVTLTAPFICLIPFVWFNLMAWQTVLVIASHMAVIAPYGFLAGAVVRRFFFHNRSVASILLGVIFFLLLLVIPYAVVYPVLYEQRPLPENSLTTLIWQVFMFVGFLGTASMGTAITLRVEGNRTD